MGCVDVGVCERPADQQGPAAADVSQREREGRRGQRDCFGARERSFTSPQKGSRPTASKARVPLTAFSLVHQHPAAHDDRPMGNWRKADGVCSNSHLQSPPLLTMHGLVSTQLFSVENQG